MNILSQQIMSENEEGDEDQELLVKTKPKTKKPPLYKVLLINDDYTPMEFVVMILERFFGLTHAQALFVAIKCSLLKFRLFFLKSIYKHKFSIEKGVKFYLDRLYILLYLVPKIYKYTICSVDKKKIVKI